MPKSIRILQDQVINKIAAGEVIEEPASVVKELVENSVDAGSSAIQIETKGGGRALITVADNGRGMEKDDLLLCLERHATSKITNFNDLFALQTLGFRGEALPSIASCSKMRIITSSKTQATELYQEGGRIFYVKGASRSPGTTVAVQSLFFNVPVRKKFAKSVAHETAQIYKTLILQALAHPNVQFSWLHDGKERFSLSCVQKIGETHIEALLGIEFLKQLTPLSYEERGFKLEGFIGKPWAHRSSRSGQYLFLNHRPITSPLISNIMKESYQTALPERRHPLFVLSLTLPSSFVDVNVHPQKKEVRFQQESKIDAFLHKAMQKKAAPQLQVSQHENQESSSGFSGIRREFSLFSPPQKSVSAPKVVDFEKPTVLAIVGYFLFAEVSGLFEESPLVLVDAKKAAWKIGTQNMHTALEQNTEAPSQTLLMPFTFECRHEKSLLLQEIVPILQKLGIGISPLSGSSFLINALPPDMEHEDIETFVEEITTDLEKMTHRIAREKKQKIIGRLSRYCFPRPLSKENGSFLIKQLAILENPFFTQEGECIIKAITEKECIRWLQQSG